VVLDGDGSLLMNLGSLVTIAALDPPNLIEVVLENSLWELPGAVPLPGAGRASLAGFARAAGWRNVVEVDALDPFTRALERALAEPGPWFISARVAPGSGQGLPALRLVDMTRRLRDSLAR
jgi:phosphonopyruvate decarboxylase